MSPALQRRPALRESVADRVARVARAVELRNFLVPTRILPVAFIDAPHEATYEVEMLVSHRDTGARVIQVRSAGIIHESDTDESILYDMHETILHALLHELDEAFTYQGRRWHDPHAPGKLVGCRTCKRVYNTNEPDGSFSYPHYRNPL